MYDPTLPEPRRLREEVNLTQYQIGALIHSPSARAWQDWERGDRLMPRAQWELALFKTGRHPSQLGVVAPPARQL